MTNMIGSSHMIRLIRPTSTWFHTHLRCLCSCWKISKPIH